ncbi:PilN domain-containing protein [Thermosynechococcus sp. HN-54]|uniref:PilN domain-containing protein n=1 Tax=Thermosynechococcus sp. HN-54 TaxID=2933959 RepID=UPI00202CDECE|nr:PilN domain-containing protein [Thermosynechococcus sp. HN-54]URR34702.1 PilN domain-containing protein [Thermosynechococcus sp. HN-54]
MYSIEINLLKERPEVGGMATAATAARGFDNVPIIIGGVAALFFVGLALLGSVGANLWLQQLTSKQKSIQDRLAAISRDLQRMDQIKKEQEQIAAETKALATVFNQVKPWSAVMRNMATQTPAGVQIRKITQGGATPQELTIEGTAVSFDAVSDFLLLLQNRSPFFDGKATQLVKAERANPQGEEDTTARVSFSIKTAIASVPASELLEELAANGVEGLVARIQFLKEKGVVEQ